MQKSGEVGGVIFNQFSPTLSSAPILYTAVPALRAPEGDFLSFFLRSGAKGGERASIILG